MDVRGGLEGAANSVKDVSSDIANAIGDAFDFIF